MTDTNLQNDASSAAARGDMPAFLLALRALLLESAAATQGAELDDDDRAMPDASSDDVLAWVDDLEARGGYDVANMRAAALDYCLVRDGWPETAAIVAHHASLQP